MRCFSRPLPSLESPQQEFLTPTEEIKAAQEIPPPEQAVEEVTEIQLGVVKEPVGLSESLRTTAELPEATPQTLDYPEPTESTKAETQKETNNLELSEPIKEEEQPPEELPEPEKGQVSSFEVVEKPAEVQEATKSTEKLTEPPKNEEPETTEAPTGLQEAEEKLIREHPEETPVEIPPEEPLEVPSEETEVTETVQDPDLELQDSG